MGLFTKLFGGADGIREAMRESYQMHVKLARQKSLDFPHAIGLYGALGSRYKVRQLPVVEVAIWAELSPFLEMNESDAIEAIAEYAVFQQRPNDARQEWLAGVINEVLLRSTEASLTAMATSGYIHQFSWYRLLEPRTVAMVEGIFWNMSNQ
jgi:hypothetical protein